MYNNIEVILASKHKKETAIRQPFADAFQARLFIPDNYDTDKFGTFTGEIARSLSQRETVIAKAKDACQQYHFAYGIASEGSFGPHPVNFFVPADIELMSFHDTQLDITVVESIVSLETNYSHLDIHPADNYDAYLKKIKFGSHAIVVRAIDDDHILAKGITVYDTLKKILEMNFRQHAIIRLETDMRAMMNPTRMQVIHELAIKLADRLKNNCRQCGVPGFGEIRSQGKLTCRECDSETHLYQHKVLCCIKCDYQEIYPRDDGLTKSDPQFCPLCNP